MKDLKERKTMSDEPKTQEAIDQLTDKDVADTLREVLDELAIDEQRHALYVLSNPDRAAAEAHALGAKWEGIAIETMIMGWAESAYALALLLRRTCPFVREAEESDDPPADSP